MGGFYPTLLKVAASRTVCFAACPPGRSIRKVSAEHRVTTAIKRHLSRAAAPRPDIACSR
eukprot:2748780-Rhodomonas_salina.5